MLRELLTTWENWSARDTLTRALNNVTTDNARDRLHGAIAVTPQVDPLDALRAASELVELLTAWRWQTVYAARRAGATWEQIAEATGATVEQVHADLAHAVDCQERIGVDVTAYREAL
ncbi:hypothetical protein ACR9E3_22835 [Actinomycetospora sp. C-140]